LSQILFTNFFGENILKVTTSVPGLVSKHPRQRPARADPVRQAAQEQRPQEGTHVLSKQHGFHQRQLVQRSDEQQLNQVSRKQGMYISNFSASIT
jgi:hypothetical protein